MVGEVSIDVTLVAGMVEAVAGLLLNISRFKVGPTPTISSRSCGVVPGAALTMASNLASAPFALSLHPMSPPPRRPWYPTTSQSGLDALVAQGGVPCLSAILQWPKLSRQATLCALAAVRNLTSAPSSRVVRAR
jgi:hypothetical protein